MNKNTIIVAVLAIIIIIAIVIWGKKNNDVEMVNENGQEQSSTINNNNTTVSNNNTVMTEPELTIRKRAIEVGQKMKLVSTLAGDFKSQVQSQYGTYVTPALLAVWKAEPAKALARTDAKISPDHIEITSVTKKSATMYTVNGMVIEVGPDSPNPVSMYPVTLTFENDRGVWLITGVTK